MNTHVWWYLARSSGIVAWALLAGSVLLGLVLSTRALGHRPAPAWTADLHRGVGGMAVTFTALHLLGLVADSTVQFDVVELFVPFASQWRPGAVAWGIFAFYLLIAVELSSLLRRRLSTRVWRWIHLSGFPLYIAATAHLLTAGTDAASPWLLWPVWATMIAIASLTLVRLLLPRGRTRRTATEPVRDRPSYEMRQLADEVVQLLATSPVPTPTVNDLFRYVDPAVPPMPAGSTTLPLRWR